MTGTEIEKWCLARGTNIDAHFIDPEQATIEITMFHVPKEMRSQGVGTRFYEEWERSLPTTVQKVRLYAADTNGRGSSDAFWERLGFDWKYTAADAGDLDDTMCHTMHKGVNGHPTPAPIFIGPSEDEPETPAAPKPPRPRMG